MNAARESFVKQLWLNLAIFAVAIVGGVVALFFILSDVRARAAVIAQSAATIAGRNTNLAAVASLAQAAPVAANYQVAIAKLLPSRDSLIQFPRQIQAVAAAYNVVAQASFAGEPSAAAPGAAGVAAFSLSASGKPDDLLAFLKNLETQSPQFLIAVDSADVSFDAANSRLTANGRVFFR